MNFGLLYGIKEDNGADSKNTKVVIHDLTSVGCGDNLAWSPVIISKLREAFAAFDDMILSVDHTALREADILRSGNNVDSVLSKRNADLVLWGQYVCTNSYCQTMFHLENAFFNETTYFNQLISMAEMDTMYPINRFADQLCYIALYIGALKNWQNQEYQKVVEKLNTVISDMGRDGWPQSWWRPYQSPFLLRGMALVQLGYIEEAKRDLNIAAGRGTQEEEQIKNAAEQLLKNIDEALAEQEKMSVRRRMIIPKKMCRKVRGLSQPPAKEKELPAKSADTCPVKCKKSKKYSSRLINQN